LATIVVGTVTGGVSNANATITGTSAAASDLTSIDSKVGTVTGSTLATITGTGTEVAAVGTAIAGSTITLASSWNSAPTGNLSITEANTIDANNGSGTITAALTNTTAALAAALTGTHAYTIQLSTGAAAATDLTAVDTATSLAVDASLITSITGTGTEVAAVATAITNGTITHGSNWNSAPTGNLSITEANAIDASNGSGTITGALVVTSSVSDLKTLTGTHAYTIVIAAGDATSVAADLALIDAATSVAVDATAVTSLTGSVSGDTIDLTVAGITYHASNAISVTGGAGADAITLRAADAGETLVFEATAAGNGVDTITNFTAGATKDVLNFSAFLTGGTSTVALTVASSTAVTAFDNAVTITAKANLTDTATGVLALGDFAATGKAFGAITDGSKGVVIVGDGAAKSIYYVYDADATAGITPTITLVGTLDAAPSHADNFIVD
jgi:hypothetical protein